jgi:hypothetical protein
VLQQQRQGAAADVAAADQQDATGEGGLFHGCPSFPS